MAILGVIGGSGLYKLEGMEDVQLRHVPTPYGDPSDALVTGRLDGHEVVFLPRHGRGHRLLPSEVPYQANIWAMKSLGVEWLLSVSAVGSLQEPIVPGHVVLVDQFIDRTRQRESTFFGGGVVAHVPFGDPVCKTMRAHVRTAASAAGATVHDRGTYVCMEGPAFSTRAESELYRSWGADVVGMTAVPECKLAREAGMSYALLALATDYDCWHPGHDAVTVEQVVQTVRNNVSMSKDILRALIPRIGAITEPGPYRDILKGAMMSRWEDAPAPVRKRLEVLMP